MSADWKKTDVSAASVREEATKYALRKTAAELTPADRRQAVVAALVGAFPTLEVEDIEDQLMPAIDNEYRAEYGHTQWTRWVA